MRLLILLDLEVLGLLRPGGEWISNLQTFVNILIIFFSTTLKYKNAEVSESEQIFEDFFGFATYCYIFVVSTGFSFPLLPNLIKIK